jgi:CheY-like chemotaxis protein
VLWLGDCDRHEFVAAREFLLRHTRLETATTLKQALDLLAAEPRFELEVIAHSFPSLFSTADIDVLRRARPLLPLLGLMGSWCEGEPRSGQPWPGVPRVYWHQFEERLRGELSRRFAGAMPDWEAPVTVSEEERFLSATGQPLARGEGLIVIASPFFDGSQMLAEACRRQGYQTVELSSDPVAGQVRGVRAAVSDFGRFDGQVARLQSLALAVRPAPVVALLSFPRIDQTQAALAAGASAVLSKPLRLAEFFDLVSRLTAS